MKHADSRGMMPWSASCSRVRLCCSLNCSTVEEAETEWDFSELVLINTL